MSIMSGVETSSMRRVVCRFDAIRRIPLSLTLLLGVAGTVASAQEYSLTWRPIGSTVVYNQRAGVSSGPVSALWFTPNGTSLEVELDSGRLFRSTNFESWQPVTSSLGRTSAAMRPVNRLPEPGARAASPPNATYRTFAYGRSLWRSDDAGRTWRNLISAGSVQLAGTRVLTVALSPTDEDRIAIATDEGVWFSVDGGDTWNSLNPGLPNLNLTRLLAAPRAGRGLLAEWSGQVVEWLPGAKSAWQATRIPAPARLQMRWQDPSHPQVLLEARSTDRARVFRSRDNGATWEDYTSDLPARQVFGLTADYLTGATYIATERGVFYTVNSFESNALPSSWVRLGGNLPAAKALDLLLDDGGNFLYVSLAGEGVYLTYAPHRRRNPVAISAADLDTKTAAPGALITVVGTRVRQAQAGGRNAPVLAATNEETQLQLPYDLALNTPVLELATDTTPLRVGLELAETSPVIFTDREGAPLILDAETGELLDPAKPIASGSRIQILASGLGRVEPAWPAGEPAPFQDPPKVVAPVRVWLGQVTLNVLRAELAPGYVGFYLVEAQLPPILDRGQPSLRIEAGGRLSSPIRLLTAGN